MKSLKINRFSLIVACVLMIGTFTTAFAQQDILWIDTDYTGETGDTVVVEVMMSNGRTAVDDFKLQLNYDSDWFDFISGSRAALTLNWQNLTVDLNEPGELIIEGSHIQPIPVGSNGSIALVTFEVNCPSCQQDDTTELLLSRFVGDIERFESENGMFTYGSFLPDCVNHGDVNLDGEVTSTDAQLAFFIVLGTYSPTYEEECAADCLGTGEVTAADAQAIFFVVLGLGDCADSV
jgi:hypothetical protein